MTNTHLLCKANVIISWCYENGTSQTISSYGIELDIPEYSSSKANRINRKILCNHRYSTVTTKMPIIPYEAIVHDFCPFLLVEEGMEWPNNIHIYIFMSEIKPIYAIYIAKPHDMYGRWLNKHICCFVS